MTALEKNAPAAGKQDGQAPETRGDAQEPETKPANPANKRRAIALAASCC